MNTPLLCQYCAAGLVLMTVVVIGAYQLGRLREQLVLLELFKPER
jgi:hypothetical protein